MDGWFLHGFFRNRGILERLIESVRDLRIFEMYYYILCTNPTRTRLVTDHSDHRDTPVSGNVRLKCGSVRNPYLCVLGTQS